MASIPRRLHQARLVGAGVLALIGGVVVVAGLFVAAYVGGGSLILGWFAALGTVVAATTLTWGAHKVLASARPWYLLVCGALGVFLALTSPLLVHFLATF